MSRFRWVTEYKESKLLVVPGSAELARQFGIAVRTLKDLRLLVSFNASTADSMLDRGVIEEFEHPYDFHNSIMEFLENHDFEPRTGNPVVSKIWVVVRPTEKSVIEDMLFQTDAKGLENQFRGGLKAEEIVGFDEHEKSARELAARLLREYKKGSPEEHYRAGWRGGRSDKYEVVVGNIGNIAAKNKVEAIKTFEEYVRQSRTGRGRAGGEDVVLMLNGEIIKEYVGSLARRENPRKAHRPVDNYQQWLIAATKRGWDAGFYSAQWAEDSFRQSRDGKKVAEKLLKGYEDGDPEIMDAYRTPDLSGEYADDPTPIWLEEEVGYERAPREWKSDFEDAYMNAASEGFWDTLITSARAYLGKDK